MLDGGTSEWLLPCLEVIQPILALLNLGRVYWLGFSRNERRNAQQQDQNDTGEVFHA